jgi:hypothetical protein
MKDEPSVRSELLALHDRRRRVVDEDAFLSGEIHALLWVLGQALVEPAQEATRHAGEWGPPAV